MVACEYEACCLRVDPHGERMSASTAADPASLLDPAPATISGIGLVDAIVLVGYLVLLGIVAWRTRPRTATTDEYFLGGRSLPAWAVSISFMATAMSAATFVGAPQEGYDYGFQLLSWQLAVIIAMVIVAFLFVPAFYRSGVSTVYGLLEHHISRGARTAAGITFIIGRILASGARLYIAGLAVAYLIHPVEHHVPTMVISIVAVTCVAIGYVWFGGIRSVVWTDVCQAGLFLVAAVVSVVALLAVIPLPMGEIVGLLANDTLESTQGSRLSPINPTMADWQWDKAFSLPALVFGFSLLFIGAYGTDQDLAQRLLTCRTARQGMKSALGAVALSIPMTVVFLLVGQLLWVLYANPQILGDAAPPPPAGSTYIYLDAVLQLMPTGIAGLITAGVLAAAISSLTSELNALSASFVGDCWQPITGRKDPVRDVRIGRMAISICCRCLGRHGNSVYRVAPVRRQWADTFRDESDDLCV